MNPTFVEGLLVFFACLWLPTTALFDWRCIGAISCSRYDEIIKHDGSLLTCSRRCDPTSARSCYEIEKEKDPCLNFEEAEYGKCYGGVCLALNVYGNQTAGKALITTLPCLHGHDYLYLIKRGSFGCKYYCRSSPHKIVNRPDGYKCLRPDTAAKGGCERGYCKTPLKRKT
uniref:Putative salivary secreted protein n=1 Tax=Ornithodoros turicata TaxID=34597 RepID=A0A2R5L884_9ACAR